MRAVTDLDRRAVDEAVAGGAVLAEVLPAAEYDDGHLPGAVHLPLKSLDEAAAAALNRDRPVIVYCWDGL